MFQLSMYKQNFVYPTSSESIPARNFETSSNFKVEKISNKFDNTVYYIHNKKMQFIKTKLNKYWMYFSLFES